MTGTDTDALDAGLLAVANGLATTAEQRGLLREWTDNRLAAGRDTYEVFVDILLRDFDRLLAALRSERVRGEESMRDRAGACVRREWSAPLGPGAADAIAADIKALPTTDQETTHG